jgi:hypothetical protein
MEQAERLQEHRRKQMEKNFFHKLYHVAMESPDKWRKLKEAELDQRQNEEETRFQSQIAHRREASIERRRVVDEESKRRKVFLEGGTDSKEKILTPSHVSILSYLLDEKMIVDIEGRIDRLDKLTLKIQVCRQVMIHSIAFTSDKYLCIFVCIFSQKFFRHHLFRVRVKNLATRLRKEKELELEMPS